MRIATWNVNGLRAAWKKGMVTWLSEIDADVVALQEIRCTEDQLPSDFSLPTGYSAVWNPAEKKGWSGTAVWTRRDVERLGVGLDGTSDPDGRIVRAKVGGVTIICMYLPSGSSGPARQELKDQFLHDFHAFAAQYVDSPEPVLIMGDLNVAPTKLDVSNASRAQKMSGFLPHERDWFAEVLGNGWVDVVRTHAGQVQGPYTWWSNFGRARELDRGWRIDHVLANRAAAKLVTSVSVNRPAGLACSDHAPIVVDLAKLES
jgi:exodeoxyribonuclease-3